MDKRHNHGMENDYLWRIGEEENRVHIDRYFGKGATETAIPEQLGGLPVTSINEYAFVGAKSLTTIHIPKSIENIRLNPLREMRALNPWPRTLERFVVDPDNRRYRSDGGVLYDTSTEALLRFPKSKEGDYAVPEGVKAIREDAFSGRGDNRIGVLELPASLERDAVSALPHSVESFHVSPDNPSIASFDGAIYDKDIKVLLRFPRLRVGAYSIPEGVREVAADAFFDMADYIWRTKNHVSLDVLRIPASLYAGLPEAFTFAAKRYDVAGGNPAYRSLDGFMIDRSGTLIAPHGPFGCCEEIERKTVERTLRNGETKCDERTIRHRKPFATDEERSLTIPEGVTEIPDRHFDGSTMKSVILPGTLKKLGEGAFWRNEYLEHVRFLGPLETVPTMSFEKCGALEEVTLPEGLKVIGTSAFFGCKNLKRFELPDGLSAIEDYAFDHCTKLESVSFPDSLRHIGSYAFFSCSSLKSLRIPGSIRKIMPLSFADCHNLEHVELPDEIEEVGFGAFAGTKADRNGELDLERHVNRPSGRAVVCPECREEADSFVWRDFGWHDGAVFVVREYARTIDGKVVDIDGLIDTLARDHSVDPSAIHLATLGEKPPEHLEFSAIEGLGYRDWNEPRRLRLGAMCQKCHAGLNITVKRG